MKNSFRAVAVGYEMKVMRISLVFVFLMSISLLANENHQGNLVCEILDEKGNLEGDSKRTYLDIERVLFRTGNKANTIRIDLSGSFPNPDLMQGMGFQFKIGFNAEIGTSAPESESPVYLIILTMDQMGWSIALLNPAQNLKPIETDLYLEADNKSLEVEVPCEFFKNIKSISVESNSANFPKWKPITRNQAVILQLPEGNEIKESELSN